MNDDYDVVADSVVQEYSLGDLLFSEGCVSVYIALYTHKEEKTIERKQVAVKITKIHQDNDKERERREALDKLYQSTDSSHIIKHFTSFYTRYVCCFVNTNDSLTVLF